MIVSVDPGTAGAIAELRDDGTLLGVRDMPIRKVVATKTAKGRNEIDSRRLRACFDPEFLAMKWPDEELRAVVIERAWPRPGEMSSMAFRLGQNHQAVLTAAEMFGEHPVVQIAPQSWKNTLEIRSAEEVLQAERKRDQELQAQAMAVEQWPHHAYRFKAISRSGRFECALIGLAWLLKRHDWPVPVEWCGPAAQGALL